MKIRSDYLIGVALDWFMAKAQGIETYGPQDFREQRRSVAKNGEYLYRWSHSWNQTGPLIENEHIDLCWSSAEKSWAAYMMESQRVDRQLEVEGPTPLVAACRCYVVEKLGDFVDVPEGLLNSGEQAGLDWDGNVILWPSVIGNLIAKPVIAVNLAAAHPA